MLQFFVRIVVYIVTLDTIHTVRRYGARRYFSMDQLHAHRKKRVFDGLPTNSSVRCGAFNKKYSSTRRCGLFFLESYGAVRCGAVKPHRTAPHLKKKNLREKPQEGLFWPLIPKSEASYKTKKKLSKLRAHAMFVEQTSAMNDERLLHRTQRNP